jgi:hypothetical protein
VRDRAVELILELGLQVGERRVVPPAHHLVDRRNPRLLLRFVDRDEDVSGDADLGERRDAAVEHDRGPGRERVVLGPLEVGGEDRRQQQQPHDDTRVARCDRPTAVNRLRRSSGERALGERGDREPEPGADRELREDRPPGSRMRKPAERG